MTGKRNSPILRPHARELRAWRPLLLAIHLALQTACTSVTPGGAPLSGERLFERVERYADFGEHRTGGAADRGTSRWLDDELSSFGFAVERQPFVVRQFFPEEQQLELEGRSLSVFPHWLPKASTAPIRAQLAPLSDDDLAAKIAFLAPENAGEWFSVRPSALAEEAARKGARALVIALPHPSREIYATNAAPPYLEEELPIPTVILAASDAPHVAATMKSKLPAILVSTGSHRSVEATNVIAHHPQVPIDGAPWVVISTPTSGWFQCAGERGTGIALFLGLAEWVASREAASGFNWLFVANSGHELSFAGAHHSMELAPAPPDVRAWLHLGASIGARKWTEGGDALEPLEQAHEFNQFFHTPQLEPTAVAVFSTIPDLEVLPVAELQRAHSELGEILHVGYPAAGFVGPHRFFHTRKDTPEVTSPALLEPYGAALREFVLRLERP